MRSRQASTQWFAMGCLVVASLCWAGNSVIGRLSVEDIPPVAFSFWRWLLTLLVILPFTGRRVWGVRHTVRRNILPLLVMALTSITAYNTLLYLAAQSTEAINLSLIQVSLPLISIVLSIPILKVYPHRFQLLGLMVAMFGLLFLLSRGSLSALAGLAFGNGDLIMFSAAVLWGVYTVSLKRFPMNLPGEVLLTVLIVLGLIMLTPLYFWEFSHEGGFELNIQTLLMLTYVVIFPSLTAYLSWNHGVSILGANTASTFIFLSPLFTALIAIPVLGESLESYHVIALTMIFIGLWLSNRQHQAVTEAA